MRHRIIFGRNIRVTSGNRTILYRRYHDFINRFVVRSAPPRTRYAATVSHLGLSVRTVCDVDFRCVVILRLHPQQSVSEPLRSGTAVGKFSDLPLDKNKRFTGVQIK